MRIDARTASRPPESLYVRRVRRDRECDNHEEYRQAAVTELMAVEREEIDPDRDKGYETVRFDLRSVPGETRTD